LVSTDIERIMYGFNPFNLLTAQGTYFASSDLLVVAVLDSHLEPMHLGSNARSKGIECKFDVDWVFKTYAGAGRLQTFRLNHLISEKDALDKVSIPVSKDQILQRV
jgi:hypothetical protein